MREGGGRVREGGRIKFLHEYRGLSSGYTCLQIRFVLYCYHNSSVILPVSW